MTGIAEIDIDQDEDACSGDDEDDETDSVIGMYRHLQDQGSEMKNFGSNPLKRIQNIHQRKYTMILSKIVKLRID